MQWLIHQKKYLNRIIDSISKSYFSRLAARMWLRFFLKVNHAETILKLTQSNLQIWPNCNIVGRRNRRTRQTLGFAATRSGTGWLGFGGWSFISCIERWMYKPSRKHYFSRYKNATGENHGLTRMLGGFSPLWTIAIICKMIMKLEEPIYLNLPASIWLILLATSLKRNKVFFFWN